MYFSLKYRYYNLSKTSKISRTSLGDAAPTPHAGMYAGEREVLFPPLTYLEYVSHEQLRPGRTVITARPSFS